MAQAVEVRLIDDLSGTAIPFGKGETVTFSLDGRSYEMTTSPASTGAPCSGASSSGASSSGAGIGRPSSGRRRSGAIRLGP